MRFAFAAIVATSVLAEAVTADEFILASGGRIVGELTADADPTHGKYVVRTAPGTVVTLTKEQVAEVLRRSPEAAEYETVRHQRPDTVAGHWALAEWCKEQRLTDERKAHLLRILELEPDHKDARLALGYQRLGGQWRTTQEHMSSLGKVQYKPTGEWLYPQEIEVVEQRQRATQVRLEWVANLKRWRDWFGGSKEPEARAAINEIKDPAALAALAQAMDDEKLDALRVLYARAVARIGTPDAQMLLAKHALHDKSSEIRATCLDLLIATPQPMIVNHFIQQLRSKDNDVLNRAAYGLGRFKDARAVSPLIDALVTRHQYQITYGTPGGAMSASNGPNGTSFSTGSTTRIENRELKNQPVLDALIMLVGGAQAGYQFDVEAWKQWYAGQKKINFADARRG